MIYNKIWKDFQSIPRCLIERGTSVELSEAILSISIAIVDHLLRHRLLYTSH